MAKRKQPHPSVMTGFPSDGDAWNEEVNPGDPPAETDDESFEEDPAPEGRDRLSLIEEENRRLRDDIENLRRTVPPVQPREAAPPEDNEPDWETFLFENPRAALAEFGRRVEERVTTRLTRQYQQDQGTSRFWADFYREHKDLESDHDLVQMTLNAHLGDLANIPVGQAINKLADLTRQRIMRYSKKSAGRKATVEGNDPPQPGRAPREEPNKIFTLGDMLKARRAQRRRGQAA